jgi:hypothetical protein
MSLSTSQVTYMNQSLKKDPNNLYWLFITNAHSNNITECSRIIECDDFREKFIFHIKKTRTYIINVINNLSFDFLDKLIEKIPLFITYLLKSDNPYYPKFSHFYQLNKIYLIYFYDKIENIYFKKELITWCILEFNTNRNNTHFNENIDLIRILINKHLLIVPSSLNSFLDFVCDYNKQSIFRFLIEENLEMITQESQIIKPHFYCVRHESLNDLFIKIHNKFNYDLVINNNRLLIKSIDCNNINIVEYISSKITFNKYLVESILMCIRSYPKNYMKILVKNKSFLNNLPPQIKKDYLPNYNPKKLSIET